MRCLSIGLYFLFMVLKVTNLTAHQEVIDFVTMEGINKNFNNEGYIVLDSVFSAQELSDLYEMVRELIDAANLDSNHHNDGHWNSQGYLFNTPPATLKSDDPVSCHLHKIQGVATVRSDVLEKIFKHPKILSAVQGLMRSQPNNIPNSSASSNDIIVTNTVDVFGTKFYPVFPGGNSVNWHQDSHYFGTGPSQKILSVAVYLERTDIENGCFRLIPGSHKDGVEHVHSQGQGKWQQGEWVDVESHLELKSKILELECPTPGTVVLFDARLLHAANENRSSDRTRWSFFGHYVPGDLEFSWRGVNFSKGFYKDRYVVSS